MSFRSPYYTIRLLAAFFVIALISFRARPLQADLDFSVTGSMSAGVGSDGQPAVDFDEAFLNFSNQSYTNDVNASAGTFLGSFAVLRMQPDVLIPGDLDQLIINGRVSTSFADDDLLPAASIGFEINFVIDEPTEVTATGNLTAESTSANLLYFGSINGLGVDSLVNLGTTSSDTFNETTIYQPGEYIYTLEARVGGLESGGGVLSFQNTLRFETLALAPIFWSDGGGGNFSDTTNWFPEELPTGSDDIAFDIINGGYIVQMDQDGVVDNAAIEQGTVSWRFAGNAGNKLDVTNDLTVGTMPSIRAGLDVIGGTVNVKEVNIGTVESSDALVTLRENAVLDPIGNVNVGGGANAEAQLFIISGSTLRLDEGENLNITGPNSTVTADELSIGTTNQGGGVINVAQDAELTVNGDLDILDSDLNISNSNVNFGGSLRFSPGARLRLSGGGLLLPVSFEDEQSTVLINTSGLTDEDAGVEIAGAGSRLRVGAQDIAIGSTNDGEVEVNSGGELTTLADMVLGSLSGSSFGEVIVTDDESNVLAGNVFLFSSGDTTSLFEVANGAKATVFSRFDATDSEVNVIGAGSELDVYDQFRITGGAKAVMTIENGGRLLVNTDLDNLSDEPVSLVFDAIDQSQLVDAAAVEGGVTVSGAGSEIRTNGQVLVGSQSDGLLTVAESGLFISLSSVWLGDAENDAKGFLVVDGTNNFLAESVVVGERDGGEGQFLARNNGVAQVLSTLEVRGTGIVKVDPQSSILVGSFEDEEAARRDNYVVIGAGGVLTGNGEIAAFIDGPGGVNNIAGNITPGSSPGTLTIDGNFIQGEAGTTIFEIAGMTAGGEYDQLIVTGDAELDGRFIIDFIDGFAPSAGDTFDLLPITGEAMVVGAIPVEVRGLKEGFEFDFRLSDAGDVFSFTALTDGILASCNPPNDLVGDIDGDGTVGFNDFLVLSENYGDSEDVKYQDGDLDCDGSIAFTDFLSLAANFGQSVADPAQSVPEPEVGWMTFVLLGGWLSLPKTRHRFRITTYGEGAKS